MRPLALPRLLTFSFPSQCSLRSKSRLKSPGFSVLSSPIQSQATEATNTDLKSEYKPGIFDNLFLALFRNKMVQVSWIFNAHIATKMVLIVLLFLMPTVLYSSCLLSNYCMSHVGPFNVIKMLYLPRATQEVGWDSEKPGYDGLIEVANRLMMNGRSNAETAEAAVRILRSLFPPFLLELFKMLIAPIDGGKVASMMVARVTALSCQWLMGSCTVNSVDLPDGSSCTTGVFVERCKYLEESKCIGICINTCKLPTQAFFKDYMGVPLLMEPNFSDYSCQFKFGVSPPLPTEDKTLKEPCLDICPNATRRRQILEKCETVQCPKV